MTALLKRKARAVNRKNRFKSPKSGDYLSWFYCSGERNQSQVACLLDYDCQPGLRDRRSGSDILKTVPRSIPGRRKRLNRIDPAEQSGRDIVDIVKRARSRARRKLVSVDADFRTVRAHRTIDSETLGTFIGGAAHHFNNLFMVIQGNISLMTLETDVTPPVMKQLKRIESLVQSESILTNDLMGYAFAGQCRQDPHCQQSLLQHIFSIDAQLNHRPTGAQKRSDDLFQDYVAGFTRIMHRFLDEILRMTRDILTGMPLHAPHHHRFQTILGELDKGLRLIENLHEYIGIDMDDNHAVNSNQLTETLLDACSQPESQVRFHLSLDPHLAPIKADPQWIAKIIARLVQNATEAQTEGGDIYLEARNLVPRTVIGPTGCMRSGRVVVIGLRDTGPGVDPAIAQRIFDPFFTTRRDSGSAGLGLASVRGILTSIGGSIRHCPRRGPGAAFEIYLPAADLEVT
jgi:signal transduction histidine kinase